MLNILIENFDENFLRNDDKEIIEKCLSDELKLLTDIRHLETNVIGKADFQWDYNAIHEGFTQLVRPFMRNNSWTSALFLHALRDLDNYKPEYIKAIVLLEYSYYGTLINDFYNFHQEFTKVNQDLNQSSKLTQLKYAGQYLNAYPRYLLIENKLEVDKETLFNLHKWVSNIYIILGVSRGLFVKWSHSCFNNLRIETYFQNVINYLSNYILYPMILAAILSKVPVDKIHSLKKAFSYLTLFAKLRCEKRVFTNEFHADVDTYEENSLIPITFQGVVFIKKKLKIDPNLFSGSRYPYIRKLSNEISQLASKEIDSEMVREIENLERKYFDLFLSELNKIGLFKNFSINLRQCFNT